MSNSTVRVLAIAMACTLTAALVAGLPRMRRLTDTQPGAALRGDARSGLTKEHRRTATMFVAAQVAVSIVLLFGGVLLLRTFMNLVSTAPGFDPRDTVTIRASIPTAESSDPDRTAAGQDALADAARSLPGVTAAAHAMFIPFTQGLWGDGYRRAGTNDPEPRGPLAHFFMVSPDYLGVMGMPVLEGPRHHGCRRWESAARARHQRDVREAGVSGRESHRAAAANGTEASGKLRG